MTVTLNPIQMNDHRIVRGAGQHVSGRARAVASAGGRNWTPPVERGSEAPDCSAFLHCNLERFDALGSPRGDEEFPHAL